MTELKLTLRVNDKLKTTTVMLPARLDEWQVEDYLDRFGSVVWAAYHAAREEEK